MLDNFKCGGYVFNANFDSGNLALAELVPLHADTSATDQPISIEFNVQTRPDCAGTLWENPNRSWFYFSIHGGEPGRICKINVINMNKQAKLFNQGMHPVVRIGEQGKWERVKDSPVSSMHQDQFCMSFLHKPNFNNPPTIRHYYAFTYPFSYTECQEQLDRFDELHQKCPISVNYIIQRLMAPATQRSHAVEVLQLPDDPAPPSAHAVRQAERTIGVRLAKMSRSELETEIYYHRELLVRSVEGRRVDLMTISAFNGIRLERESRLPELFPEGAATVRCNVFHGKPVIFISSRVHPGETPASHVLNGFLKLLLDAHSLMGAALRKMYVFKIVPFLNPDGVYEGCYRSDTLGHNLNRVYNNPSLETQPTIYAVRKLVRYYHHNADLLDFAKDKCTAAGSGAKVDGDSNRMHGREKLIATTVLSATVNDGETDNIGNNVSTAGTFIMPPSKPIPSLVSCAGEFIVNDMQCNTTDSSTAQSSDSECASSDSPRISVDIAAESCPSTTASDVNVPEALLLNVPAVVAADDVNDDIDGNGCKLIYLNANDDDDDAAATKRPKAAVAARIFQDKLLPVIKPIIIEGEAGVLLKKPLQQHRNGSQTQRNITVTAAAAIQPVYGKSAVCGRSNSATAASRQSRIDSAVATLIPQQQQPPLLSQQFRIAKRRNTAAGGGSSLASAAAAAAENSSDCCNNNFTFDDDGSTTASQFDNGNLFLYIDMHGHASKKGIFMYGNHFPTTDEAIECMLLPRLMSMNCHHFHFDSCVFSERNMYSTGKRDGLSKEGSGRVSMYKATGLIKCYTLEGNYNTGKYVNVLPPRGKEPAARKSNLPVPKYSPVVFEEVGRALGPSILDLTGSNPMSRIQNSDFKSVQGLRNALRVELERLYPRSLVFNSAVPVNKSFPSTAAARRPKSAKLKAKQSIMANGPPSSTKSSTAMATAEQRKKMHVHHHPHPTAASSSAAAAATAATTSTTMSLHELPHHLKLRPPFKENKQLRNINTGSSTNDTNNLLGGCMKVTGTSASPAILVGSSCSERRTKRSASSSVAAASSGIFKVLPSSFCASLRSSDTTTTLDVTAASNSSSSTSSASMISSSAVVGIVGGVVGKRKTLKLRPKCTSTTMCPSPAAQQGGAIGAAAAIAKPTTTSKHLKRGYSSKDSLRLKRKKKRLPKGAISSEEAAPAVRLQ